MSKGLGRVQREVLLAVWKHHSRFRWSEFEYFPSLRSKGCTRKRLMADCLGFPTTGEDWDDRLERAAGNGFSSRQITEAGRAKYLAKSASLTRAINGLARLGLIEVVKLGHLWRKTGQTHYKPTQWGCLLAWRIHEGKPTAEVLRRIKVRQNGG